MCATRRVRYTLTQGRIVTRGGVCVVFNVSDTFHSDWSGPTRVTRVDTIISVNETKVVYKTFGDYI